MEDRLIACSNTPLVDPDTFPLYIDEINPNLYVVRDDILCGGTKSRLLYNFLLRTKLIDNYREFIYVSPWYGGAQIALAWTCRLLEQETGIPYKATIFLEETEEEPEYTAIARLYGANIIYKKKDKLHQEANSYAQEKDAFLLRSGFAYDGVEENIAELTERIKEVYGIFDECWAAVGSGTLIRGIQRGDISHLYFGLCVFQECPPIGKAYPVIPEIGIDDIPKELPPFPSAPHYDAKVWSYVKERSRDRKILFWNVM